MRRNLSLRVHVFLAGALLASGLLFAIWGYLQFYATKRDLFGRHGLEAVLASLKLFKSTFDSPPRDVPDLSDVTWQILTARVLLPIGTFYAAGLVGWQIFRRRLRAFFARWKTGHAVVAGPAAPALAPAIAASGRETVLIASEDSSDTKDCDDHSVAVVVGDPSSERTLQRAAIEKAEFFLISGPDGAANSEIALAADRVLRSNPRARHLSIAVEVDDLDLVNLLGLEVAHRASRIRIVSRANASVRQLLTDWPPDVVCRSNAGGRVHILLVGFGRINSQVIMALARGAHYADGHPPLITVFDRNPAKIEALLGTCPGIARAADVRYSSFDVCSSDLQRELAHLCSNGAAPPVGAVVSLQEETLNLAVAVRLRRLSRECGCAPLDVAVHLPTLTHAAEALRQAPDQDGSGRIIPFGTLDARSVAGNLIGGRLDRLARALHEHYRRGARNGSMAQSWDDLPEEYREANRWAADHISAKLRAINADLAEGRAARPFRFADAEIEQLAEIEHRRWCAERLVAGWQPGPRNELLRTHPSLKPWAELDEAEREKDRQAVAALPEVVAAAHQQIVRARLLQ